MTKRFGAVRCTAVCLLTSAAPRTHGQNIIGGGSAPLPISGSPFADGSSVGSFLINVLGNNPTTSIKFKLEDVLTQEPTPNFLIVSPSNGTTPARVTVAANPNVTRTMPPGRYVAGLKFASVDQSPPSSTLVTVVLTLDAPAPPGIGAVVNTASFQPVITPGSLVSIFGESLGPPVRAANYDSSGRYPTAFGNTTVTLNGVAAPLLYVSPSQINAIVPGSLAGQKSAQVIVSRYGASSNTFSVPVSETSPAIFTYTPEGSTQGAPLNYRFPNIYTPNSVENPAAPGSVVVLFATGAGVWEEEGANGAIAGSIGLAARPFTLKPVSLTIGGQPSRLIYAGAAPYQSLGMLQINAYVPEGIGPGLQPVVLKVDNLDNTQQQAMIAIR